MSEKPNAAGLIVSGDKTRIGRVGKSKRFAPYVAGNIRLSEPTHLQGSAHFSV